jgi:glycosyltransferase involved in cell wall biosynthesis/uncharacterized protein YbaR (Trm112 family)
MNHENSPQVQWMTPLPPLRTGISRYSRDLLRAVDGLWNVLVVLEGGSELGEYSTVREIPARRLADDLPLVIQIGNSEFHRTAFRVGRERRGILVLHDVVLHHALLAASIRNGNARDYWRELQLRYGAIGQRVGRELLLGKSPENLSDFPLSELYIEWAKLTLVHSHYARALVERFCPGAAVEQIPMGVPIPAPIDRSRARAALGLADSNFIVASITHVNPNKRLPVVLRAMRKLVARLPEAQLILAGTGSDSLEIKHEVRQLGLESHVAAWGYVDEARASLLAFASDACVNLRHPSTGETSASLLRLLAAGLPVLVTDGDASSELPAGVGLPVPVDRFEAEMVAEILWSLSQDDVFRAASGRQAREYVIARHGIGAAVDGYRSAIESVYDVSLPGLANDHVMEPDVDGVALERPTAAVELSPLTDRVVGAVADLGLGDQDGLLQTVARASVALGLDDARLVSDRAISSSFERLAGRLACPVCHEPLATGDGFLYCRRCVTQYETSQGIPLFTANKRENPNK